MVWVKSFTGTWFGFLLWINACTFTQAAVMYNVTTILTPPFTMMVDSDSEDPNTRFVGYMPDLVTRLSEMMGFGFKMHVVADSRYGSKSTSGKWSGMIGELIDKKADIVAAPLTITSHREREIDYITAFMHIGLTVVMKKPQPVQDTDYFTIVKPLAAEIWIVVIVAFIVVSLSLWAMNHFNPYEWGGAANAAKTSVAQSEYFSLQGSLWYTFTILQWQGFDRSPRSWASKVLSCFWMMFVTITLMVYTGSLFNHIYWASTFHQQAFTEPLAQSFEDLVGNPTLDYGTIKGGSTMKYFQKGRGSLFEKVRTYWQKNPDMNCNGIEDGLAKVRESNGKYGFIMESSMAMHRINQLPCDLMILPGARMSARSYGMAVREDFPEREALHQAVLTLHENGEMEALQRKWFLDNGKCWDQGTDQYGQKLKNISDSNWFAPRTAYVSMKIFWGPVLMMGLGVVIAALVAAAEILYYRFKGRYTAASVDNHKLQINEDNI